MKFFRKNKWALPLALVMAMLVVSVAMAITIVVDGDEEAVWTSGSGGQKPGSTTDPNESGITDNRDISHVYWTNDTTNFYFMIRTYATPSLGGFPAETDVYFCIDTDNDTSTGSSYANCNNMPGIDRYIHVEATDDPIVYGESFNVLGTGALGYNPTGATNPVIEVSVTNALLGLDSENCPQIMPMVVYFDNGTTDPDDNTPDSGSIDIGCGSPTAITLSNFEAKNNTPVIIASAGALLLLIGGGAVLAYKRRQA